MEIIPKLPPRPQINRRAAPDALFDQALQDWLDIHVAYWASEECVVLPKVAVNAMRTVANWRCGSSALITRLPVGTPVATFMNRRGDPSDLWDAGEGLGAPGNDTTHAGVLAGYQLDAAGTVAGLKLWELYPNCGGVRRNIYPVDDTRFGTKNARAYHAILEPNRTPLGGVDNPWYGTWARAMYGTAGRRLITAHTRLG